MTLAEEVGAKVIALAEWEPERSEELVGFVAAVMDGANASLRGERPAEPQARRSDTGLGAALTCDPRKLRSWVAEAARYMPELQAQLELGELHRAALADQSMELHRLRLDSLKAAEEHEVARAAFGDTARELKRLRDETVALLADLAACSSGERSRALAAERLAMLTGSARPTPPSAGEVDPSDYERPAVAKGGAA